LPNYYDILGLPTSASVAEVKSAFRLLAKRFHPDLNPAGKDQFTLILKAYEVLCDPQQKYVYDYRLSQNQTTAAQKTGVPKSKESGTTEKKWRFDERELRRRQYYNEHIKKYEKKTSSPVKENTEATTYNEFKYILFATPLAVLLFVGIMHFANGQRALSEEAPRQLPLETEFKSPSSVVDKSPYGDYFGEAYYLANSPATLTLRNLTGADAVICLFDSTHFLRSFILKDGYSATVPGLPQQHIQLRYSSGRNFDEAKEIPNQPVQGGFSEAYGTYKTQSPFNLDAINQLTLLPGLNDGFQSIRPEDFFIKHDD